MNTSLNPIIFRYVEEELTVLFPYVERVGYMVGKLVVYPPVEGRTSKDILLDDASGNFYIYINYVDTWLRIDKKNIPKDILAWCTATGKYVK